MGPMKWHRADRRVPFHKVQKSRDLNVQSGSDSIAVAVVFTRDEKLPFQSLFKNFREKPAFQKATF
jgi:hypothetical protein